MAAPKNPRRGENHYRFKVTDDDARLMRALVLERERLLAEARKLTDAKIAEKFDVHPHTVWKVTRYESRRHVR
ncbi:MAG: hypothetical protein ACM3SS_02670 [Rhodospirillaceae bacterium]